MGVSMGLGRVALGLAIGTAIVAGSFTLLAQAQQSPQPYPPYPPRSYPTPAPPPLPFPFPIPFPDPAARDLLLDGADKMLRALELMIQTIPTYDPPVVTPDGDILIKRRRAVPRPPPSRLPAPVPERTVL